MDIKFNSSIRIEQKQRSQDADFGADASTWVTFIAQVFVNIQDILSSGQESTNSDLRQLKRPAKVRMRYIPTITADMRIVLLDRDNRVMQIISQPAEIGRLEGLEFMVEEYQPDGTV